MVFKNKFSVFGSHNNFSLNLKNYNTKEFEKYWLQHLKCYPVLNYNFRCETLIDPCNNEAYDSDMIPVSMKKKIHDILSKYKNGILCNKFMDIYEVSIDVYIQSFYIR